MIDINHTSTEISPEKIDSAVLVNMESKNDSEAVQKAEDVTHDLQGEGVPVQKTLYRTDKQNISKVADQINDEDSNKIHMVQHNDKIINDKFTSNDRKKINAFLDKLLKNSLIKLTKSITTKIKNLQVNLNLVKTKTEISKVLKGAYRAMNRAQPLIQIGGINFFNPSKSQETSSGKLPRKRS